MTEEDKDKDWRGENNSKKNNTDTMDFQRASWTSGRGSGRNVTPRLMCWCGQSGGWDLQFMEWVLVQKGQIRHETHLDATFTADLKRWNREKDVKPKYKERESQKITQRMVSGRLTTWTGLMFVISAVQWCLLCYKTESNSDLFASVPLAFGDGADLANQPLPTHAFTSKTNKDKRFDTQLLQNKLTRIISMPSVIS